MKHNAKRKVITLVLAISMVFTMSVPAFAWTSPQNNGPVYFAIGDSIGAGCKNLEFMMGGSDENTTKTNLLPQSEKDYNEQFDKFTFGFEDMGNGEYKKNTDINAVEFSYISRVAKAIGADAGYDDNGNYIGKSVNGSYVGLRAKDVCNILGIPAATGDTYDGTVTGMGSLGLVGTGDVWHALLEWITSGAGGYKNMFTDEVNKKIYTDGIANADVITIELGENDLSAFMFGGDLGNMLVPLMNMNSMDNIDIKALIKSMSVLVDKLVIQSQYYFINMMKYVKEHKKDGAVVVVSTMINPMEVPEDYDGDNSLIEKIAPLKSILDIYLEAMNAIIKTEALTYDYIVADVSDVILLPNPDKLKDEDGQVIQYEDNGEKKDLEVEYIFHPNDGGQQQIADEFVKQIKLAPITKAAQGAVKGMAAEAILYKIADDGSNKISLLDGAKSVVSNIKQTISDAKNKNKTEKAAEAVKQEEPAVTETVENPIMTEEEVAALVSDATLRCTTEKTSKGIKVTAKVTDADLDALTEDGYTVAYKFYRSTKKSSGYKYMLTSKTGKYTNTSVKKGSKYYYKTKLVVTDSEGNEITSSVLKNCKYGARTF